MSYSPSKTERRGAGGRATMKTYGAQFMRSMDRKYMEGTKDSVWRRYKRMDRDFDYLFRLGKLSTTSPAKFTPEDVHNFISYRMSLDVSDSEMVHELAALSNIFAFISLMRTGWPLLLEGPQYYIKHMEPEFIIYHITMSTDIKEVHMHFLNTGTDGLTCHGKVCCSQINPW